MAAMSLKRKSFLSRFKPLLQLQNLYHKFVEVGSKPQSRSDNDLIFEPGEINISKWKKIDSRSLGITRTMVPSPPYVLLKILRTKGFEAYLVGGCVRDLLLNRTPKDFDVITTASLKQIRNQFHRCEIVGRRFPICRVHIKGSIIEVSSFKTLAKHAEGKEHFLVSQMPRGCDKSDLNLWKNSMHRDFTINSLFFDPLVHKIYDYANGMEDLLKLKVRTLVPAHLSFTEDCARILRALRIAARLGLSFSKDIETAIHKYALSILDLSKSRIMMEINYMLSFGAAESSFCLLHKFHVLEILLPFQAAYISQQATRSGQSSIMLMKLFSHLDKLVTCDHPSGCRLWIGLLAFHLALVNNPQDSVVVLTFASVLYHQKWEEGLQFARQCGRPPVSFEPEISEPCNFISDDELSKKVHQLALQVLDSVDVLVETDCQHKTMSRFPGFPCSGLVFIPKNTGRGAAQLFHILVHNVETYNKGRTSFEMDYNLLVKEDTSETRFALGKIILNTMGCGVDQDGQIIQDNDHAPYCADEHVMDKKVDKKHPLSPINLKLQQGGTPEKQKLSAKLSSIIQHSKKRNAATEKKIEDSADGYLLEKEEQEVVSKQHHTKVLGTSSDPIKEDGPSNKPEEISVSQSPMQKLICMLESVIGNKTSPSQFKNQKPEKRLNVDTKVEVDQLIDEEQGVNGKYKRKRASPLSGLFK